MPTPTALLVIDVQRELFERSAPVYKADLLLNNIVALANRAHRAGALVVYVQQSSKSVLRAGSVGWQLHPRLKPLKKDLVIQKTHSSALEDTGLEEALQAQGINRLVVTGLVTNCCVKSTCVDAQRRGFEVLLVADGHSNFRRQADKLIAEWNAKLADGVALVLPTKAIRF